MGAISGKVQEEKEVESFGQVIKLSGKSLVSAEVQYAHYTPSTFPLVPQLKPEYLPLCRKSWQVIVSTREKHPEYGTDVHGITAFYNEFYERLAKVDTKGLYENILVKHAVGTNRIAAKGAILVRIVDFLLKFDGDNAGVRQKLNILGQSHNKKGIRPWQYSVFLELFILTLGSRLKKHATPSVMEAWVNLLAYSLKYMLPPSIDGIVLDSEAHVNFVLSEDVDINAIDDQTVAPNSDDVLSVITGSKSVKDIEARPASVATLA